MDNGARKPFQDPNTSRGTHVTSSNGFSNAGHLPGSSTARTNESQSNVRNSLPRSNSSFNVNAQAFVSKSSLSDRKNESGMLNNSSTSTRNVTENDSNISGFNESQSLPPQSTPSKDALDHRDDDQEEEPNQEQEQQQDQQLAQRQLGPCLSHSSRFLMANKVKRHLTLQTRHTL